MLLSGAVLCLAGLGLVPLLPVSTTLRAVLAGLWFGLCGREWYAMFRGYAGSGSLHIAAGGQVRRQCSDGTWQPARLCAGSIVLPRFAWLRIKPRGMRPYAEPVRGECHESQEWRRLQVIWRHIGAV
ncbi:MAG: hypothetical protein GWP60_00385 [Gammaproteobacteria bacterium]|nr:hypothetical protein [Gammaproteobacteria bacterium]